MDIKEVNSGHIQRGPVALRKIQATGNILITERIRAMAECRTTNQARTTTLSFRLPKPPPKASIMPVAFIWKKQLKQINRDKKYISKYYSKK